MSLTDLVNKVDNPDAPVTPTRAIGTAFAPSATRYVWGSYTVEQVATHGQDGTVTLLCDAANPPTTARCSARLAVTDDAAGATTRTQLTHIVPPGHYVKLVATGTGTNSVASQVEVGIS